MRERRLARPRRRAAADDRRRRGRVMRRPEGRRAHQPGPGRQQPGHRVDPRHLERGRVVEQRQDPRQPAREHRLADARAAREQQVVRAGGGDLERAPRALLAAHVGELGNAGAANRPSGAAAEAEGVALAAEVGDRLGEMPDRHRLDAGQRDLGARLGRADQPPRARSARSLSGRERSRYRPQPAVERQLPDRGVSCEDSPAGAASTRRAPPARSGDRSRSPPCAGRRARG